MLTHKGASFEEIEAGMDPIKRKEMMERSGRSTFPQIFIGDRHIGGCDDMVALDRKGELDALLAT
jgi:glutaredoxin 3